MAARSTSRARRDRATIPCPPILRSSKLNGLGRRKATFFKVKVYVGALYPPQASKDASAILKANAPNQRVLYFVHDVGGGDVARLFTIWLGQNASNSWPQAAAAFSSHYTGRHIERWTTERRTG